MTDRYEYRERKVDQAELALETAQNKLELTVNVGQLVLFSEVENVYDIRHGLKEVA